MTKKLKIRIAKFKNALAIQVLEMEGKFSDSEHVKIGATRFCYDSCTIASSFYIQKDNLVAVGYFGKNEQRDEYFNSVVKWISEELFATNGKLEIGEMCEISEDRQHWAMRRLLAILPENYESRFIVGNDSGRWSYWSYARPLTKRTEPTVEECGQLITYTWEDK